MRSLTGLRCPSFLPFFLLLSCLLPLAQGFFPSDWREKYFGNGGVSHEAQTREAYDTLAAQYFPDITPITANMIKARTTIAEANMKVDDDQTASAKHFDGENFAGGQAILVQAKVDVTNALRDGNGEAARKYLGAALHTVQDFYAHTNWVELRRSDINPNLGKARAVLSTITFGERTCNECGFGGLERVLFGCHDCTTNTDGFNSLTSGYYFGEDSPPPGVAIPDHKCHHGGATDSRIGSIGGVITSDVFRDVTPGINKDSNNCFWSPHHFHHPQAVEFAIKASIQYIEDIVTENNLTEKEKKILFGVGTTLAFAIDTTGSMAGIIAATREQAIAIARGRIGTKDEPIDYVVAPFNDPTTGPVFKTTDFDAFQADINTLSAFGGGDCPELALGGILDALDVMEGPAELFVMTDAAAKDFDVVPTAIAIAVDKRISFHVFKFDSNCDDGIASKRDGLDRRVDSAANRVYSLLAASTGGTYHSLPASQAGSISNLLDALTLSESNTILKLSGSLNETGSFDVPVDSKMTEFSISLRGAGVTLSLTKPDGAALDTSSSSVTLTTVSDGQFLNVKAPVPGVWKLTLNLGGSSGVVFTCDVTGVSPLHLSSFNFVALSGRPGHTGYYPIKGQPAFDHDVAAVAVLDGTFNSAVFDLRDSLASHAVDTHMAQGSGAEGAPPTNSFYGEMRLANQALYAYAEGTDAAGAPFQRVLSTVFQPFLSNTTDTGFNSTDIFAGRNSTNVTISSSSAGLSSTSTALNSTSTSLPVYPTSSGTNTTLLPYPTASVSSSGNGSYYPYPKPSYSKYPTYHHTAPGKVKTHSEYPTPGCDSLIPSTYTTTSTYTISDDVTAPYTTVSTLTVTTYVPVLCSTCTGGNYPHHTGSGPWGEEDESVIKSGYGDYVSTVDATPTQSGEYEHYTAEPSSDYYHSGAEESVTYIQYKSTSVTEEAYAHYTAEPEKSSEAYCSRVEESSPTCTHSAHATATLTKEHHHYHHPEASSGVESLYTKLEVEYPDYSSSTPPAYPSESKYPDYSHPALKSSATFPAYPSGSEYLDYIYSTPVSYPSPSDIAYSSPPPVLYPSYKSLVTPSDTPVPSPTGYGHVLTASIPVPVHSINSTGTTTNATASESAPSEFTGAASKNEWKIGGVVLGVFGGVLFLV